MLVKLTPEYRELGFLWGSTFTREEDGGKAIKGLIQEEDDNGYMSWGVDPGLLLEPKPNEP